MKYVHHFFLTYSVLILLLLPVSKLSAVISNPVMDFSAALSLPEGLKLIISGLQEELKKVSKAQENGVNGLELFVIEEIKFYTNDTIKKKSLTQLKNKLKELLSPTIQMKYHGLKLISGNKGFDVLLDFELYKDQKLMSVDELLDQIKKELNVEHPGMFQVMLEPAIAKNVPVKHASTLNSLVIKQSELVKDTSEFIITADEIVFSEKKKGADTSTK